MFTLNFCDAEEILPIMVNLVHESMFSNFWGMMLQDWDLSQGLWRVAASTKLFWKGKSVYY